MKQRCIFALFVTVALIFSKPAAGFAQSSPTLSGVANDLSKFSKDMRDAMAFISLTGLVWSDTYIGQLINITPHWGIGLSAGATTLKMDNLNALLTNFGFTGDKGFMDKQILPVYTIDLRLGGLGSAPFDVGLKWGYLPYIPMFKGDINYEASVAGIDFRWELLNDWGNTPSVSIGLELDSVSGGLRRKSRAVLNDATENPIIILDGNATAGIVWEGIIFGLKLQVAKSFWEPYLNIYAGLRIGGAITKTGYKLTGGDDIRVDIGDARVPLSTLTGSELINMISGLQTASRHGTTFSADNDTIICLVESTNVNCAMYSGLAFSFGEKTHLDLSIMLDILNAEMGAGISFRYQQ
jgi:hypothetical protein